MAYKVNYGNSLIKCLQVVFECIHEEPLLVSPKMWLRKMIQWDIDHHSKDNQKCVESRLVHCRLNESLDSIEFRKSDNQRKNPIWRCLLYLTSRTIIDAYGGKRLPCSPVAFHICWPNEAKKGATVESCAENRRNGISRMTGALL